MILTMPASATLELETSADPLLTMAPLWRGPRDREMRIGRGALACATRTPAGPASLELRVAGRHVQARAWGPGAGEALARLPGLSATWTTRPHFDRGTKSSAASFAGCPGCA